MDTGPSVSLVFSCLCIAPLIGILCVILLVWLAKRSRDNLPKDAVAICSACGREMGREAAECPHCGTAKTP